MTNVLVVEDNFYQSKQIINYLSQRNKELKLYSMVYSGEEALEIIEEQKVDIIILDLKLKGMNGVDVIIIAHISTKLIINRVALFFTFIIKYPP